MAVVAALFVSKRIMPVAAAFLLLASARLAHALGPLETGAVPGASAGEVRVVIAR